MKQDQAIECFGAMAQETRIAIMRLLVRNSPDGLRVTEIAKRLDVVPSTLSGHLNVLRRSGLLKSRRNQREIIYSVDLETINDMMLFILEECCDGDVGSCARTFQHILPEMQNSQAQA